MSMQLADADDVCGGEPTRRCDLPDSRQTTCGPVVANGRSLWQPDGLAYCRTNRQAKGSAGDVRTRQPTTTRGQMCAGPQSPSELNAGTTGRYVSIDRALICQGYKGCPSIAREVYTPQTSGVLTRDFPGHAFRHALGDGFRGTSGVERHLTDRDGARTNQQRNQ
jgi:hypothetical protein